MKIEGPANVMPYFIADLREKAPVISQIEKITIDQDFPEGLQGFFILASQDMTDETSEISPDIAVCNECLDDLKIQSHRIDYPFINCTNCGPRFSIIRDFPYDRAKTTMADFTMCRVCRNEYEEIQNRRFHAQPVACNQCGPVYQMHSGNRVITELSLILEEIHRMITSGKIIAIKGTGGFHLMCDALNESAVSRLRKSKKREGKPFAVMFKDVDTLRQFARVSEEEERALVSWRRPVVILKTVRPLANGISMGLDTLGAFLPYMPLHHMLFLNEETNALVLTSGNLSEEPIIIDNHLAIKVLSPVTDAVVTYNRDIYNRTDDSVVRIIAGKERVQRRSRGYVPAPVRLGFDVDGILAAGAELANCFCLGKGNRAYLSQHIGDLKNNETFEFYTETISRFQQLFRIKPRRVAVDMHPDYFSTRYGKTLGIEITQVQHHHAHIASCMAENGVDEKVIGLAFAGTGYGTDGNTWGSEFLVCDFAHFTRHGHFAYMPMPGGDKASEEPWRMGLALLYQAYGRAMTSLNLPLFGHVDDKKISLVIEAIDKNINCPLTSGAGRLFDAVAAISGVCVNALFHAEAPMKLESVIDPAVSGYYSFNLDPDISFLPAILQICEDVKTRAGAGVIAAKFHNTIAEASHQMVKRIHAETGILKVVLSGGTFQNKYLLEKLENKLAADNFTVFTHSRVPCNDGGIALGQLVIAARSKG